MSKLHVRVSMVLADYSAKHQGKRHRFADLNEARRFAEKKGYDDGIYITVSQGYGLKPRVDALAEGGKSQDHD